MKARALVAVVLTGAALHGLAPMAGSTGVAIDVGRIDVSEDLAPGGEYRLPMFGVRNPGGDATSYVMVVSYVDGQDAQQPPGAWFTFSPANVTLGGGQSQAVNTSLEVPPDAAPGEYAALIGPQVATDEAGAQIGAGVAAHVTFTVGECHGFDCWLRWISRWIGEHLYVLLIPMALVALIGVRILRRRFAFTIQRRAA